MSLVEKDLADTIVRLRKVEHDDPAATVGIGEHVAAVEFHLEREQWWRQQMTEQTGGCRSGTTVSSGSKEAP